MSNNPSISIIVPVLDEEGSLEIFYSEITTALIEYPEYEVIFVDALHFTISFCQIMFLTGGPYGGG